MLSAAGPQHYSTALEDQNSVIKVVCLSVLKGLTSFDNVSKRWNSGAAFDWFRWLTFYESKGAWNWLGISSGGHRHEKLVGWWCCPKGSSLITIRCSVWQRVGRNKFSRFNDRLEIGFNQSCLQHHSESYSEVDGITAADMSAVLFTSIMQVWPKITSFWP